MRDNLRSGVRQKKPDPGYIVMSTVSENKLKVKIDIKKIKQISKCFRPRLVRFPKASEKSFAILLTYPPGNIMVTG